MYTKSQNHVNVVFFFWKYKLRFLVGPEKQHQFRALLNLIVFAPHNVPRYRRLLQRGDLVQNSPALKNVKIIKSLTLKNFPSMTFTRLAVPNKNMVPVGGCLARCEQSLIGFLSPAALFTSAWICQCLSMLSTRFYLASLPLKEFALRQPI